MLTTYTVENGGLAVRDGAQDAEALRRAVWIDMLSPSPDEERQVQAALRLEVPTREEMQEIESSSRLYREGETLFLTANFLYGVEGGEYGSTAITFVLGNSNLITVRYATPRAFEVFGARCQRTPKALLGAPDAVMLHLFEQVVDRLADILERSAPTWTAPAKRPSAPRAPRPRPPRRTPTSRTPSSRSGRWAR
jgi:magnesium transporter